jgi:hypothetical protein
MARRSRLLPLLLLAGCVYLGREVYLQANMPPTLDLSGEPIEVQALPPLDERPGFEMRAESEFAAIMERPLFVKSRRPKVDAPPPTDNGAIEELRLSGIVAAGRRSVAIADRGKGTIPFRLKKGYIFHGWTVHDIGTESLVFMRGEEEYRVTLQVSEEAASEQDGSGETEVLRAEEDSRQRTTTAVVQSDQQ